MILVISPAKALDYETPVSVSTHTQPDFLDDSAALIEVLRRLVRLESAQRSVFHYGCFVADRASALAAAEVLVDLGAGRSALGPVEKYGTDSEEARAILARLRERAR